MDDAKGLFSDARAVMSLNALFLSNQYSAVEQLRWGNIPTKNGRHEQIEARGTMWHSL
jgi:hypothetical protein